MKVLQINSVFNAGSTGRIASNIHHQLHHQNYESFVIYGRESGEESETTIKIGTNIGNYLHVVKTRFLDLHGFGSKNATLELLNLINEIKPDVIHLHNIHGYFLNIEILFTYLKKIKVAVVWTLHDCWSFTGHCAYFDYANCEKWKTGCYSCPEKKSYPTSIVKDNSKENYHSKKKIFNGLENLIIVTPSVWLKKNVKNSFLKDYPVITINNGIDLDLFKPTKSNFKVEHKLKDKYMILGVANEWDRRKGLKFFIDLSPMLKKDEVIVLVGLSNKQIEKLPRNIVGISKTNSIEDLAKIYSSANVFINPTLEDNFPTTNLESLACGTPVITFETGGSPETIDKSTGYVVKEKTAESLYEMIKKNRKQEIASEDCRKRALKYYSQHSSIAKYISLYRERISK